MNKKLIAYLAGAFLAGVITSKAVRENVPGADALPELG